MLTRLKISGFKNLHSVDLRFGFFTCIAGPNGVGKSNLFDAIQFLSDLSSLPIAKAVDRVRGMSGKSVSIASLFGVNDDGTVSDIEFLVEAVVPKKIVDEYSQEAEVTSTCLEYKLALRLLRSEVSNNKGDRIEIVHEELRPRSRAAVKSEWKFVGAEKALNFVDGRRTTPFIETKLDAGITKIFLRSDNPDISANSGAPPRVPLTTPRTVLSGVDSISHASQLALRREMQSWRLLQLEPSALREPDSYRSDSHISVRGEHLPAAVYRIGLEADVAADLAKLVRGIETVEVISNDLLELRTLVVTMNRTAFPASALSDGTLRFLALSVMACDPEGAGLVCMEEPENGIHPTKIPEMIDLVKNLSDAYMLDELDPARSSVLRQVIINTHSPLVVAEVNTEDLLFAQAWQQGRLRSVAYKPVHDTWRAKALKADETCVFLGEIESFLSGNPASSSTKRVKGSRVRDLFGKDSSTQRLVF
jgi:predicted ATPase